ncbi:glycosyltransferase [Polaribacter sp. MSW5]|uniref:Glycosyltransferase n=1 Tax=Polaribacter ponticola TaxID=2978475 RepID=A0ABT5S9L3_9FLAO|nr:glycosyltransferase [Polaribacter sp. MSW5]MDD7914797.1 glycosyltransferase [Polaribacter sp. MSW5]
MPVLNNLLGLQKTIISIKSQTFSNYEVWIIDGKSSKETQEYLEHLEAPFFYQSEKDKGIYDAMNKGIAFSNGEWLYFLGAGDELYHESVLENCFLNRTLESVNLIAGNIVYVGNKTPFIYSKNKMTKNPSWSNDMWIRNGLHHQGTFYKKVLFLNTKYPLKYKTLSDYWLNLILYKQNEKCFIIESTIAKCNSDGVSKSGNWNLYKEEVNLKTDLTSLLLKPIFYIVAFTKFLSRKIVND